jgi:hypothetical protein
MVHSFKLYGQHYAFDLKSGAIHKLSELQFDMLKYLKLPFENAFPSSLRYDLAKYSASDLSDGYLALGKLNKDGVFDSDTPFVIEKTDTCKRESEKTVEFNSVKFVFSAEVIKLADEGIKLISAKESDVSPVKETDYDILESEYERIAKEIIKRRTGRVPFPMFEFSPFDIAVTTDSLGYTHVTNNDVFEAFGENGNSVKRKIAECAIALSFIK